MDAVLMLPSRASSPAISGSRACCPAFSSSRHNVCRHRGRIPGEMRPLSFRTSNSRMQTDLMASFKVEYEKQLGSGQRRMGVVSAKLASQEAVSDDVSSTNSDSISQSVALLKTAAKTRKVSGSEICKAIRTLEKAKIDPKDFPSIMGGTKSPGRTWLLVFNISKDEYNSTEGGGKYFPVTAVQNFDGEASRIENGVFLGPLGALSFTGSYTWEKRKLAFDFNTLNLTIGSYGPIRFNVGGKEKKGSFFIWYYADDEIVVARGRAGGTAFWVRCTNVKKSIM